MTNAFRDTEYVCDQCNEDIGYGDSKHNTQVQVSESSDNHAVSERDLTMLSRNKSICNDGNIPIAMSDTGTSPKTPFISTDPNLSYSRSQSAPNDIPLRFNCWIVSNVTPAHISQD